MEVHPCQTAAKAVMVNKERLDPNEQLWCDLETVDGDDSAARAHLAAGRAIYYAKNNTPQGLLIKEYPDGHRELVRFHREGDEVIRTLSPQRRRDI